MRMAACLFMVALTVALLPGITAAEPFSVYNLNGTGKPLVTAIPCDITSDTTCGTQAET